MKKHERQKINSLKIENLKFAFEDGAPLFEAANFDFPAEQMVWVQGENGSGRSTLLQILAGLLMPQQGAYLINGENIVDMSFEEFLPYRLNIGYGFDMGGLLHNRTLEENLALPLLYHDVMDQTQAEARVREYMTELGIMKYFGQRPAAVPGGVRKLVCLIRALIMHPELLILDDPSVGLTQDTALKYFDLIDRLRKSGEIRHVFLSSFDEKLMSILDPTRIVIDNGLIHNFNPFGEKKVAHL